jgi:hypothetical protein
MSAYALAACVAEEGGRVHHRASLLEHLAFECLPPVLVAFGTAPREHPGPAILTDEHDRAVGRYADAFRAVALVVLGNQVGWMPRGQPVLILVTDVQRDELGVGRDRALQE